MKSGSKFLIGFASAVLTFSTLVAFVGPPHTSRYGDSVHGCYGRHHEAKADSVNHLNKR